MNLNIQSLHFDADGKLLHHIEKKVDKLNQFHDRITHVDIFLKLDNLMHNIKDKVVEQNTLEGFSLLMSLINPTNFFMIWIIKENNSISKSQPRFRLSNCNSCWICFCLYHAKHDLIVFSSIKSGSFFSK